MSILFECFTAAAFYAALIVLFARWGERDVQIGKGERFAVWTIEAGFLIGGIEKLISHPVQWTAAVYLFGAVLAGMVLASQKTRGNLQVYL